MLLPFVGFRHAPHLAILEKTRSANVLGQDARLPPPHSTQEGWPGWARPKRSVDLEMTQQLLHRS